MIAVENVTVEAVGPDGTELLLDDVSFELRPGDRIILLGANGAGKTTLLRAFIGLVLPDRGQIRVDGVRTDDPEGLARVRRSVGLIFQQPEHHLLGLTIGEELALAARAAGLTAPEEGAAVARRWGLTASLSTPVERLSRRQLGHLALAAAVTARPRYLFLDECAALDPMSDGARLWHRLDEGTTDLPSAWCWTTPLPQLIPGANRLLVLEEGRLVYDGNPIAYAPAIAPVDPPPNRARTPGPLLISAQRRNGGGELKVRAGEVVAVVGPAESGKTRFGMALAGCTEDLAWRFRRAEAPDGGPEAVFVMADPEFQLYRKRLGDDVSLGPRRWQRPDPEALARRALAMVGLPASEYAHRNPLTLSGGEMRRAALACALAVAPRLLVADEPTHGLDPIGTRRIARAIRAHADAGGAVIVLCSPAGAQALAPDRTFRIADLAQGSQASGA